MAKLNLDAKQVLSDINMLITELKKTKEEAKNMGAATAQNFAKMEKSIKSIKKRVEQLGHQMNYLKAALKQNNIALKENSKETRKNEKEKKKLTDATKDSAKAQKGFNLSLKNLLKGAGLITLARQMLALAQNIYSTIKTFDSLNFTLEKITKSFMNYEDSQRFLLKITKAYGVELVTTTTRWARFLAAANESGLALRETQQIFESLTKASAVLGLNTDELTSVYLALEQMLSKGKITTEELRRQLGERLPGAMGIMAASMGVSIPVLDKMMKKGEVLSAEVLPDFARAVEQAYGIENETRIETLIAKQNRLTASWQTFIKNISEGDSIIKKVIGGMIDLLNEAIEAVDWLFQDEEQRMRVKIMVRETEFEDYLRNKMEEALIREKKIRLPLDLDIEETELKEALKTAIGDDAKEIQNQLDEIAKERVEASKMVLAEMKKEAAIMVKDEYELWKQAKEQYETILKDFEDVKEGKKTGAEFTQEELEQARAAYRDLTASYNTYRKLIEQSSVEVLPDSEVEKTQRRLRRIRDYWLETLNEIMRTTQQAYDRDSGDETLNLDVRLEAMRKSAETQTQILRNEYAIQVRDAESKFKSEVASLEQSVEKGTLARGKANDQIKAMEDEKSAYILLKNTELSNAIIALNNKTIDEMESLTMGTNKDQILSGVEDMYNQRIAAAKKAYEESERTANDEIALERALAQAAQDATNDIIDAKIRLLKSEIALLEASGEANAEYIQKLRQEINKLEADRQTSPLGDSEKWKEVFEASLDLARDFSREIGQIFDNIFRARINAINAEIQAEEDKYDRLIELAEGDEEQQKTLQRNKEDRIKKLEKERQKEQQKQAKARKKFAIADIAISTARAIMGIWADFPKFDFGITAGVMSGVVAALGAAQIAAVLSTPIPKYAKGVKNLREDQIAMINDGGYQEYIERNNRILSTSTKNAIVPLKKGDTVYRNYDDMIANSNIFNVTAPGVGRENKNNMIEDITKSVIKGMSKAKIKNNVKVLNIIKDNRYRDSLSRWN